LCYPELVTYIHGIAYRTDTILTVLLSASCALVDWKCMTIYVFFLHSENTERLEMLLREAKKSASQQVLEMSQHIKV